MQWDDIRFFLALYRSGTLSAAAREMGVEHTTVSRRIGQLETSVGLKLFKRLPRSWVATPQAVALYDQACSLEEVALGFRRTASGLDDLTGRVRISVPPILASHILVPGLDDVIARYPNLALEIQASTELSNLNRNEADIAIRLVRPESSDLMTRSLGKIGYGLFGTPDWSVRSMPERLYIGFDDLSAKQSLAIWLQDIIGQNRVVLRTGDFLTMAEAAKFGWGIALLPYFLGKAMPDLVEIIDQNSRTYREASLLVHRDVLLHPGVRAITSEIVEIFRLSHLN
ncbi:LysR family transcriptional regulator [bacterium]|nr:LysR family transcriptional regulator [bacterium]